MKARNRRQAQLEHALRPLATLVEQQRYDAVEKSARELLRVLPAHPFVLKSLSFALIGQQRHREALPVLERAIAGNGRDAELHNNLGIALTALLRTDQAIAAFDRALELAPADPDVWKNKGAAHCHNSQWKAAVPCLLKAVELYPDDNDEAIDLLAAALLNADMNEEAYACVSVLVDADPENAIHLASLIVLSLRTCRWTRLGESLARLRHLTRQFELPAVAPFHALSLPGIRDQDLRRVAACHVAATVGPANAAAESSVGVHVRDTAGRKLRVGYLSHDFRDHPVGHVIPQVIELHDRSTFEVFGYSMSPDDGSAVRRRLARAFDHWVDMESLGIEAGAERIAADRIDILVDLQGWTTGNRAAMLALRPAPVQVNWLGYAGTMGDPRLADVVLGDPIVTPFDQQAAYSETIVQLPECYLPLDATHPPPPPPDRAAAGLPADAFVFCSMNNCYKFNPEVFDTWCAILRATPGSILWLGRPVEPAATNLLAEATARGVAPERIVFAQRVAGRADHLARLQLAHLALDPWPYNSHSSGLDVLWAGVPMVTLPGATFAARVGASLLSAARIPECIAGSPDDYRDLCVALHRDSNRLDELRRRLVEGRTTAPLFDMPRFVRALEGAYVRLGAGDGTGMPVRGG